MNPNLSKVDYWLFGTALLLVVLANLNGPGYTYDSYDYFLASRNIDDFLSQREFADGKVIRRPPVFPLIISFIPDWFFRFINPLLFILNSVLFFQILGITIKSRLLRSIIFAFFLFGIPIHLTHAFLWTEPLVISFLLLQIYVICDRKNITRYYILLPLLAAIMVLTKNGSMLLIVPIALLAFMTRGFNYRNGLVLLSYVMVAFFAFEFWSSWVQKASVSGVAVRALSFSLSYLDVFSGWFMPLALPLYLRISILLVALGYLIVLSLKKRIHASSGTLSFMIMFTIYLVLRSYYSAVDYHESERYLSLGYPIFLLAVAGFVEDNNKEFTVSKLKLTPIVLGCWLLYSVVRVLKNDFIWFFDRFNL